MQTNKVIDAWAQVRRELNLVTSQELKKFPYGHKQMLVLYHLGRRGPLTMGELADVTLSDKATITRAVASLEKLQFVKRAPDKDDNRKVHIHLLAKGKVQADKAQVVRRALVGKIERSLGDAEQTQLATLLEKLARGLQDQRAESEK